MVNTATRPATAEKDFAYPYDAMRTCRELRRDKKLKPGDAEVLGVLLRFRLTYRDSCWCPKKVIARELSISERSAQYRVPTRSV
jgi:hypothetical protein